MPQSPTTWTYCITAAPQPRVLARVVQLFDQQLLTLTTLILTQGPETTSILLTVEVEPALARRLHAKLLHLHWVEHVHLTQTPPSR
jgi:hypothetical protein